MWPRLLAIGISSLVLAGCAAGAASNAPVTVVGECNLFTDPGFTVRGETRRDQRWIAKTQETGIVNCGWPRPATRVRKGES